LRLRDGGDSRAKEQAAVEDGEVGTRDKQDLPTCFPKPVDLHEYSHLPKVCYSGNPTRFSKAANLGSVRKGSHTLSRLR
jgi:hypothetical protein